MRTLAALAAVVLTVALAGCGDDGETDLPDFTPPPSSTSAPPTPSATTAEAPAAAAGEVPKRGTSLGPEGNPISIGVMVEPKTDAERAVVLAYLKFWVVRARALRDVKVDKPALAEVAIGDAAARVASSVHDLAAEDHHAKGGSVLNVRSVKVTGRTATLLDCFQDFSVAADERGRAVEALDLNVRIFVVTLVNDDGWKVRQLTRQKRSKVCVLPST